MNKAYRSPSGRIVLGWVVCFAFLSSVGARAAIYMDEDFEGGTPFVDQMFPVVSDSTQPVAPLAMGLNIRAWGAAYTTPTVQLSAQEGTVVSSRSFEGTQCYQLASGQHLTVAPGQFPFRDGNWYRAWQFAVGTDAATAGLAAGTQVGHFDIDYSTEGLADLNPDVTIQLALRVNATGGVDLVCVNKSNAVIGTLSGAADDWLLVTLVAMNRVTDTTRADTTEGWAAYDSLTDTYKGPQPTNPLNPVEPLLETGVHVFVDGVAATHTLLTRAGELGTAWGNESGAALTAEIGWEFAAENGGTIFLDNLSWDGGGHQEFGRGFDREEAARLSQFGEAFTSSLPGIDSTIKLVFMVVHAHLDIGFTDPPEVVKTQYKNMIDNQRNYAQNHPGYKWTVEETWQLEQWLQRSTPTQINNLVSLVNSGQISVSAGHSTLHSMRVGAEEMTRHLWNAARYRNLYGFTIETLFHDDVPGINWAYPQVLARSGIKYLVSGQNLFIGGGITQPYAAYLFRWEGPDGSQVLTWSRQNGYAQGLSIFLWVPQVDEAELTAALEELTSAGYPYDAVMIQTAFDNASGTSQYDKVLQWNATHSNPQIVVATAEDFFEYMETKYGDVIPVMSGNWHSIWDVGGDVGPREKIIAKNGQDLLPVAEQMNAFADVRGLGTYDYALFDTGWDQILQIDEHTGPGGSWPNYWTQAQVNAANQQYRQYALEAWAATSDTLKAGIDSLLGATAIPGDDCINVYNPMSWVRSDLVRLPVSQTLYDADFTLRDGVTLQEVPCQKDPDNTAVLFVAPNVPSLGFKRFRIEYTPPSSSSGSLTVSARTIENSRFRVTLDDWGYVTSLYDKSAGRELVDTSDPFQFNRMIQGTNLQFFFGINDIVPDPPSMPAITIAKAGPVAASLRVARPNHPHAAAEIILYEGLDRIDIVDTPDRSEMLYASLDDNSRYYAVSFPFNLTGAVARIDTAAGWLNPATDTIPGSYHSAYCIQHGLDLSESNYGVTFATPDVYVHAFGGFQNGTFPPPNPTVVSTFIRYGDEADLVGSEVGYVIDEPGAPPQWDIHYSIAPHARAFDPAADARFSYATCAPLQAKMVPAASDGTFLNIVLIDAPNVVVTSVKKADFGSGVIVKMQEIAGVASTNATVSSTAFLFQLVQPVTPLEDDIGPPLAGPFSSGTEPSQFSVTVSAREIVSLRLNVVENPNSSGVALWLLY